MPKEITLFTRVTWKNKTCIVTNASIAGGKFIQISPVGNGDNPAQYFKVSPNDVLIDSGDLKKEDTLSLWNEVFNEFLDSGDIYSFDVKSTIEKLEGKGFRICKG